MRRSTWVLLKALAVLTLCLSQQANAAEFRGSWVDARGSGYESPTATTTMLDDVQACNCNAVIVEMRKRGDAYSTSSIVPTGINMTPQAGYDCLADIVTKTHDRTLDVHPWAVIYRVWTFTTPPATTNPDHVFNTHPEWFNLTDARAQFDSAGNRYPGIAWTHDATSLTRYDAECGLRSLQLDKFERLSSVQHRVQLAKHDAAGCSSVGRRFCSQDTSVR